MQRADRDRWLALALLLAVLGLLYLLLVHPWFTQPLREADARIAELQERDARVRALLQQAPLIRQRLAGIDARGSASGFLAEPTAELATAALIQQLERVVPEFYLFFKNDLSLEDCLRWQLQLLKFKRITFK